MCTRCIYKAKMKGQRKLLRLHPSDGSAVLRTPAGTCSPRTLAREASCAGPCHVPSVLGPTVLPIGACSTDGRCTYAEGFGDSSNSATWWVIWGDLKSRSVSRANQLA
jgi:hypothetical protein